MPIGQLVRLFDSLSISVWTVCLPVHQFVCRLSVSVCPSASMSVCLSLSVCPSMWSVCLSISHSVYRSVSRGLVSSMVSQVRSRASSDINSVCNIATTLNRPVGFFGVTVIAYVFERLWFNLFFRSFVAASFEVLVEQSSLFFLTSFSTSLFPCLWDHVSPSMSLKKKLKVSLIWPTQSRVYNSSTVFNFFSKFCRNIFLFLIL